MSDATQDANQQTYLILEGVRRTKAASLLGHSTIAAKINGVGKVLQVPIVDLLSPKPQIDTTGIRGLDWGRVYRATQANAALPPIEITPDTRGFPIEQVTVVEEDFDIFR